LKQRNFVLKIFYPYLFLFIITLIFFGLFSTTVFKDFYIKSASGFLESRAIVIRDELLKVQFDSASLYKHIRNIDSLTDTRITIILSSGKVIYDTRENPVVMDNHSDRPEVIDALNGKTGSSLRYSKTLNLDLVYVALPLHVEGGKTTMVVRAAMPLKDIDKPFSDIYYAFVIGGIAIMVIAGGLSFLISKRIFKPINNIKIAAESYAKGDFSHKIYPAGDKDLNKVTDSLNEMASQLDQRLRIIGEQKNIQQAVLESMKEGVLAVDYDERILLVNNTAQDILLIPKKDVIGKTLQEVVRVSEIQKFFKKILNEGGLQEAEIIITLGKEKTLQLTGTILYDINDKSIGALVVLNDISNLKFIDTIKKDLVANVSHELKTPITTIKGFIETLKDGAIKDPVDADRFLDIISKHIERLNLIIDDLLSLSKLERKETVENANKSEQLIAPLLNSVVEDYTFKAKDKNISISVNCENTLRANVNSMLIEQALSNLIDNAIKYSDINTQIEVNSFKENGNLSIVVKDQGWGIESEHIPRLFERFYRVDKSRSREVGGTGLGLAIVKHVANVHGGTVKVESTVNKGSTFSIVIPIA